MFVLNDPYVVWLNNFNSLIARISPGFSPAPPFSFLSLLKNFIETDKWLGINSMLALGVVFIFVLFCKFKWKSYLER